MQCLIDTFLMDVVSSIGSLIDMDTAVMLINLNQFAVL